MSLRKQAMSIYKPPFRYQHGYIFDSADNMVSDQDTKTKDALLARVRGWGRIQYMNDAANLQDEVGRMIADALTEYYKNDSKVSKS